MSSLPVPFSPWMRMFASLAATLSIRSKSSCIFLLLPITFWNLYRSCSRALSCSFSSTSVFCLIAFSSLSRRRSASTGFSRKSNAPALTASTERGMFPWPVMTMTSASGSSCLNLRTSSMPSKLASSMSVTTASGRQVLKISSPRVPMSAVLTSNPLCSSRTFSHSVMAGSSSIARMRLLRLRLIAIEVYQKRAISQYTIRRCVFYRYIDDALARPGVLAHERDEYAALAHGGHEHVPLAAHDEQLLVPAAPDGNDQPDNIETLGM